MTAATAAKLHGEVQLEHVCSYWASLAAPEIIGPLAEGLRLNFYATGGEVYGPKMRGRLRPVGDDWLSLRPDGIGVLDVRATLELEDGALIYTTYGGIADLGPDDERFVAGNPPAKIQLRITRVTIPVMPIICGSIACSALASAKSIYSN
jgi:hypothetical protein